MGYYVGIDVGGTFTDICVANQDGKISVYKTPTLPDIGSGVIDGLRLAAEAERLDLPAFLAQVERFGQPFAPRAGNWREGASSSTVSPDAVGFHIRLHPELELRQFLCPGCGGSLSVEAAEKGAPDIQDIELV